MILDEVRKGLPTKLCLDKVNNRVMNVPAKECFTNLISLGKYPLC